MRFFVVLLDPRGEGIPDAIRRRYESLPWRRGLEFAWHSPSHAAVLTAWDDPYGDTLIATESNRLAVGEVRLDNREEIERQVGDRLRASPDLGLALRAVAHGGITRIPQFLGDFAFIVWDHVRRMAIAACDALSVKKLYYAKRDGLVAFASRAEALAIDESYDVQYLAELTSLCIPSEDLTVYAGVRRLPGGTVAVLDRGAFKITKYWSPEDFVMEPLRSNAIREAPARCQQLLADSVKYRLAENGSTWAQLSGGLDSSSIVSVAQWLSEKGVTSRGLGGTVTFVDWQGTDADEREYSEVVARRWRVHNEVVIDPPFWCDDYPPPHLDQPMDSLAFYPRDRRLCAIVRDAGAHVLLAGFGSDELFTGTTLFFADWLTQGRVWATVCELARWATIGRVSFWRLAYGNAILPLLPARARRPRTYEQGRLLPWISPTAARRYGLQARVFSLAGNSARRGGKYHSAIVMQIKAIATKLDAGVIGDILDVRYPFLYRPLVEFALRLPPELCARPQARKWVLREAMRGILPETVGARIGKGAPTDVLVRSLTAQRDFLASLVCEPILAELGVIDAAQLRAAFDAAPQGGYGDRDLCTDVQTTLMAEAWLRIRSGRWPQGPS